MPGDVAVYQDNEGIDREDKESNKEALGQHCRRIGESGRNPEARHGQQRESKLSFESRTSIEQGSGDQWDPVTESDAWVDELVDFFDELKCWVRYCGVGAGSRASQQ